MSMLQKTLMVVALVLFLLCSFGTFVMSRAGGVLMGVFPLTVTLMWVYLVSVLLLGAGVLLPRVLGVRVAAWLGFVYALMAFLGIFTSSLLGMPLQGGNLWVHLLVALALLYGWLILPHQTGMRKTPVQTTG